MPIAIEASGLRLLQLFSANNREHQWGKLEKRFKTFSRIAGAGVAAIGLAAMAGLRKRHGIEQSRLQILRAEVAEVLQRPGETQPMLQKVAELLVKGLEAAFARVWTLDPTGQTLELQASAGLYTHLDGAHARVPVGKFKIGLIAQERRPHVTNQVLGDPRVHDQDWVRREGMVAFAGYPLMRENCLLGVVALFARHKLSPGQIQVFEAISHLLAQALARKKAELEAAALRDQLVADLAVMNRLHDISTRFVQREELQSLLDAILDAAIEITRANKGNLQLLDAASGELGITAQRGFEQPFIEFFSHIRMGNAACGTAMQTKQCVVVEDVSSSPIFLALPRAQELMLAAGVRGVVCTPLLSRKGPLIGVLSVHFATPHQPRERELYLLELLARQAADFIDWSQADAALHAAREELSRANQELERKVQERTAKLEETVGELEHFSYTLTHDMRAPLRAMQGFGTMLLEQCGDCLIPPRRDMIRRIVDAAARMDRLIIDALDYTKVMRKELPLTPVDAAALLRGIIESYPQFQLPHAEVRIEGQIPMIWGNEAALTQCFSNLLGNAVKFVAPGQNPCVGVRAEKRDDWVRIWVEDNGIGIRKESQDRIFLMFQRIDKSYEGTGIGLALVKKVVERMGGKVGLESEEGKGSRFWVELQKAHSA